MHTAYYVVMKTTTRRAGRSATPQHTDRHKNPREVFHLPHWLQEGIEKFRDGREPRPSKSAAFRFLIQRGLGTIGIKVKDPEENGSA